MRKKSAVSDKLHLKVQVWIAFQPLNRASNRWKILLLKMRKDRGGFWQPVTGSVEKGEALFQAALREAQEETGLDFRGNPKSLRESFQFESRWGGTCKEHGFFFIAHGRDSKTLPKVKLDPREHTDYEWMSPSRAERRLGFASNRRMLRALRQRLRR